jgi:hypothetical protein
MVATYGETPFGSSISAPCGAGTGPFSSGSPVVSIPIRGVYGIGRLLVDEFNVTGGLTPTMINHATSLIVSRVLRAAEQLSRKTSPLGNAGRETFVSAVRGR